MSVHMHIKLFMNRFFLSVQFQREQMKQYCSRYPQLKALPSSDHIRDYTYKHLLYDDNKKIIFCYIPKGIEFAIFVHVYSTYVQYVCTVCTVRMYVCM